MEVHGKLHWSFPAPRFISWNVNILIRLLFKLICLFTIIRNHYKVPMRIPRFCSKKLIMLFIAHWRINRLWTWDNTNSRITLIGSCFIFLCFLKLYLLFLDPIVRDQQARSSMSNSSPTLPQGNYYARANVRKYSLSWLIWSFSKARISWSKKISFQSKIWLFHVAN